MEEQNIKVTSIEDLRKVAEGSLVRLPDFAPGIPFYARLRRPSMLKLVKSGKIPNTLLITANSLFEKGANGVMQSLDDNAMEQMCGILDILCEASFIEPSWQDILDSGVELTDEQRMFVYAYSQNGVDALKSFRLE